MIDILIPVLGRSQNAQPLMDSIATNTQVAYELHFLCSPGDDEQIEACRATNATVHIVEGIDHQYPVKINHGYRNSTNPYLLTAGDDVDFQPGWDTLALHTAKHTGAGVIGINDCANKHVMRGDFSTCPLISRHYIDTVGGTWDDGPGFVLHEGYDHNMVDMELAHVAKVRGQWAFAKNAKICHRHPGWQTAPDDSTYLKGRTTFPEDHRLFLRRSRMWGSAPRAVRNRRR